MTKSSKKNRKRYKKKKQASTAQKKAPRSSASSRRISLQKLSPKSMVFIVIALGISALAIIFISNFLSTGTGSLEITYPYDGSIFPPEIIAPTLVWTDSNLETDNYQIHLEFEDNRDPIQAQIDTTSWTPDRALWESIKQRSLEKKAKLTVTGMKKIAGIHRILSSQTISIMTSKDSVGAPIFYRDVPLPFRHALRNVPMIKWRLGNISSYDPPPTVLTNLPVCGNCHTFSADGKTLGMDVDIGNDKGAYVLTAFEEETIISREKLISWSDFVRDVKVPTFGMLPNVSPDGSAVISGVRDRSVFLPRRNILFSQIFFPVMGILAYYDRGSRSIRALPGADDGEYVQANGVWTPDGQHVVFARNKAVKLQTKGDPFKDIILNEEESIEVLGGKEYLENPQETDKKFMFNLYKVPFNHGKGGKPVPIKGASHNGMSNYFPKFSPDGKWLVFTQAHSFMLLQPDSKLIIIPAEGGKPRLMSCNTDRMNSWHSWSPNSKWLVFSSKTFSPNTQLFLTHIDKNGMDSPPVLLKNFTSLDEDRGANIPEFVNIDPAAHRMIRERFLDDYNYFRSGRIYEQFNEFERAQEEFLKSLKINPQSTFSHYSLGSIYVEEENFEKAKKEFETVARLDPANPIVHKDLGSLYFKLQEFDKAEKAFKTAIDLDPNYTAALNNLGSIYLMRKQYDLAENEFRKAISSTQEEENLIGIRFNLGKMFIDQNAFDKASQEFTAILSMDADNINAHHNMGNIYRIMKDMQKARAEFEDIQRIDPEYTSAYIELGEIYAESKDYEMAAKEFKSALEKEPENLYARIFLGRMYAEMKDYDDAIHEFLYILENDPRNVYAYINLGRVYTETEEIDNAIESFKTVLELEPNDMRSYYMLGNLLFEKKQDPRTAISYLKRGLSFNPRHLDSHLLLANCYLDIGNMVDALDAFQQAFRLNPNDGSLKEKIDFLKTRIAQENK